MVVVLLFLLCCCVFQIVTKVENLTWFKELWVACIGFASKNTTPTFRNSFTNHSRSFLFILDLTILRLNALSFCYFSLLRFVSFFKGLRKFYILQGNNVALYVSWQHFTQTNSHYVQPAEEIEPFIFTPCH